jgi:DNA adenine methylase
MAPASFERYVEPFAGSACLFFDLRPRAAILGDVNPDLIKTYTEIKYRHETIGGKLGSFRKNKKQYLELRKLDPSKLSSVSRAARFIYLNRCCFNGIYRTNLRGEFNVPYGGDRSGELPTMDHLRSCASALRGAKLMNCDFTVVLNQVKKGDFVYMDPPFSVKNRRVFKEYDAATFGAEQLDCLRTWMDRLASKKIKFLVSYADSAEARELRKGFKFRIANVRRNIAGFAECRKNARELLIYN